MRRLFIAEKPNVGAAIAEVMPGAVKQRTHYVAGNDIITWCFGHILEQAMQKAGIPQEFASATLKDAQRMMGIKTPSPSIASAVAPSSLSFVNSRGPAL